MEFNDQERGACPESGHIGRLLDAPRTAVHEFSPYPGELAVFTVLSGTPVEEALVHACEYLKGATAANTELIEEVSTTLRPLGGMVGHSIGIAIALIEASIKGIGSPPGSAS